MSIHQLFIMAVYCSIIGMFVLLLHQMELEEKPYKSFLILSIKSCILVFLASPVAKTLHHVWSRPETKDLLLRATIAFAAAWLLMRMVNAIVEDIAWKSRGFVHSITPINVAALGETGNILKKAFPDYVRTDKDLRISAVHETGHVLLYALFPEDRLSSLTASIKLGSGGQSTAGTVWAEIDKESSVHTSEAYLFARMMITLAGSEAEAIALGTRHDGCLDDSQKWMSQAKVFLACGFMDSAYFVNPGDDVERNINAEAIHNMMKHQKQLLQYFFKINRVHLDELAELLLKKCELRREELLPFLERVIIPPEFPYREVC